MPGTRQTADATTGQVDRALADAKRRLTGDGGRPVAGPRAVLALQRRAGNTAVSALMAARTKAPGERALTEIDGALRELRRDDPVIDTVETGLKAAQAAGIPVELEGPKPPPSALAVTVTGFGPGAVAAKKPAPPAKPVPPVSPLGKAASAVPKVAAPAKGAPPAKVGPPGRSATDGAAPTTAPAPLTVDKLLEPPTPPPAVRPEDDPAFTRVTGAITGVAAATKAHPPAATKAKEAQDAALPPAADLAGQAQAAKVDAMDAQPVGTFDKKAFIAAVKAAIEAKSPKTLKEADDYKASGKAGEVKGEVKGLVTQGKDGQARDIAAATEAPPDQTKAVPKLVVPMAPEQQGPKATVPAAGAVPKPAPPEQVNLAAGKHEADRELADADVSETQLAESNEPEFQSALADKHAAATHADSAPDEFRQHEQAVLQQGREEAAAETGAAVTGMQGAKGAALAKLVADKGRAKTKDETRRGQVTARIQAIFAATEAEVRKILDGIDPKVEAAFEQGEARARSAFEAFVAAKMSAYKKDRYGGWLGGLRWAKDKLLGMPAKVNDFYEAGRELYLKQMDGAISKVADIVGNDLSAAKKRIATGRAEITSYVKTLPADLQKVGSGAAEEIGDNFDQLEKDVESKQDAVVDTLATKYVESRKGLDERIESLQAENRGLVDKAIGAIKAVVNTIRELAAMLKNVLARAAGVVGAIVKKPVAFLTNLIAGVKGGILKFKDNILDHLRKGLMSWLFGALAEGGVELPDTYDVKGIIKLLTSIFGLTWARIRGRLVKQIGDKAMSAVEKGVGIFQTIAGKGVAGLWEMLVEKVGDIKEMILGKVKDFVVTKVVLAGVTWLIGLLNPAAAFIKACKLIYDIVMFFVHNASRIGTLVNTILDSVSDIVRGNVGSVVNKINDVLGQMLPLIIGFLASVIGLGGIGKKIREIVETLQKPITKAVDAVIRTGLKLAGPIIRGIKGISGKVKAKVAAGKAWVKGKVEKGKARVGALVAALPGAFRFRAGGKAHRIWVEKTGARPVMVASAPVEASTLLRHYESEVDEFPETTAAEATEKAKLRQRARVAHERLGRLQADVTLQQATTTTSMLSKRQERFAESVRELLDAVHRRRMKLSTEVPPYPTPAGADKTKKGMSHGSVRCVATFRVECGPGERAYPTAPSGAPAGTGARRETTESTPRGAHGLIEGGRLTGVAGGHVLEGPEAGQRMEQKAEIVTRATGDESPSSHAEARLLAQVDRFLEKDGNWKKRVRTIEINLSHSPCPGCVDRLGALHRKLDNGKLRLAVVQWSTLYTSGPFPTTPAAISELRRTYAARGPMP
jgi:hypothetical protein